jgi:hypothetical protein
MNMTKLETATAFLIGEVEALEVFEFVVVAPVGEPLHVAEVTRCENESLEVRVPGRPALVPALEASVLSTLRERDFSSENPDDSTKPWVRAVVDAEAAVDLLREVRVEVFGEKLDGSLDIAHGSHKAEYEARKKLAVARARIEPILTEILAGSAKQDDDGDYILPIGEVHVMVAPRSAPDGHIMIRIFAITNVGINIGPELGLFLARLNFGLMFGRFALDTDHRSIWFDETLLGEHFREEELRFAVDVVASTADAWDDRLKQMFGGVTYQEVLAGQAAEVAPPIKPGEGVGMYL